VPDRVLERVASSFAWVAATGMPPAAERERITRVLTAALEVCMRRELA
jgi:hypothetical protein